MAKTANMYARIEPDLKSQAEAILSALGISTSNAITMFYKQIVRRKGPPAEAKPPERHPDAIPMTAEQLYKKKKKGYEEAKAGCTIPMAQAFANVRKEFSV